MTSSQVQVCVEPLNLTASCQGALVRRRSKFLILALCVISVVMQLGHWYQFLPIRHCLFLSL